MVSLAITLMILVDAFSAKYLSREYMPFVFSLGEEGFSTTVKPMFAFKGIETTIFTGMWPDRHGVWTEMSFNGGCNSSRISTIFKTIVRLSDMIHNDKIRKLTRIGGEILFGGTTSRLTPNIIPAEALSYFEPSQKKAIYEEGSIDSIPTFFDILRGNKINFAFIEPPFLTGDEGIIDKVKGFESKERTQFWYVKFNKLDKEGHIHGPNPTQFKESLRRIDGYVEQLVREVTALGDINILICTDHGMSKVSKYVDILQGLQYLRARMYKDYITFLDSTIARFWFFDKTVKGEIEEYLNSLASGHILSSQERKALRIPDDVRNGEMIYVMDEGQVIYPDFWSGTRVVKGMHGYAYSKTEEASPVLIANGSMAQYCDKVPVHYTDIFSLLINSLGL